jgi:hypothetical protein
MVLRGLGSPFTLLPSGEVSNQIRVKIVNRADGDRRYLIELADGEGLHFIAPDNPLAVAAGHAATATVFVTAPRAAFHGGAREIRFRVGDGAGFAASVPYRLLGPGEARP